jgi:hypothetical protein
MQKWKYLQIEYADEGQMLEHINSLGREGWELIHVEHKVEMKHDTAVKAKLRTQLPSIAMPVEAWILFFKQPIES